MASTNRLRVLRAEREITQRDLGLRVGMELTRYWSIEKGYKTPTGAERAALASALGVSEQEIWPAAEAAAEDDPARRIA